MHLCPSCLREIHDDPICRCGADLSVLLHIVARADYLFNQGLAEYQNGHTEQALEYLAINAALVPADLDARLLQSELLIQAGRQAEARQVLDAIENIDPTYPGLDRLLHTLAEDDPHVTL